MNMRTPQTRSLDSLAQGETGEIIRVWGKPEVHRYLCGKGLMMGRLVSVNSTEATSPDATITVLSNGTIATIKKAMANNIKVRTAR